MKTYKGRGIVLHTLKYGDTSMVAYLLTDVGGRRSYMVQGVRSRSGRGSKLALFQPMFPVEFEGLESPRQQMHRFKEVTGYTLHQYISQKRLVWAGELIRSGMPVMKAAEQAGFPEYSTFLRAFQNTFHTSPKNFR